MNMLIHSRQYVHNVFMRHICIVLTSVIIRQIMESYDIYAFTPI